MDEQVAVPGVPPAPDAGVSRRQVLRWAGAAGVASIVPFGLAACEPAKGGPSPDASLRTRGFAGRPDAVIGQGGWCWFQAPRMAIDARGILWAGTSQSSNGNLNDGAVHLTSVDLARLLVLDRRSLAKTRQDDHTSPSVFVVDDKIQVAWALHKPVDYLDVAQITAGGSLSQVRVHRPGSVKAPARGMAYTSAHIVAGVRWLLYRGEQYSWNLLTSTDGSSWAYKGLVVTPPAPGQRPYVTAASDGKRLHILVNDGNPSEFAGTSVSAGTIESDLTIRRFGGAVVGKVGSSPPLPSSLTRLGQGYDGSADGDEVEEAGSSLDVDFWSCDLRLVDDQPTGIISRRDPWPAGSAEVGQYRHQYLWVRRLSTGWRVEPLCWAGGELYRQQPDYTGLATQDPTQTTRVVVSTNVDPITGAPLVSSADDTVHWELFEGNRTGGATWAWTALTTNSTEDNIRPTIVAAGSHKVMGWMRGTYRSWEDFDTRLVIRQA